MRLVFHAWRASHSQTNILRNMNTMLRVRAGVDGGGEREAVEARVLAREMVALEERHREFASQATRLAAGEHALNQIALTAAALHGRALCALEEVQPDVP